MPRFWIRAFVLTVPMRLMALVTALLTALLLAAPANAQTGLLTLDTATLSSRSGTQLVNLPHKLAPQDFAAGGDRVRYRLVWALAELPQTPQAAYVGKLSLSGRLFVNGQLVGDCGNAPLERLRCLHRPQLFNIPAALLKAGSNVLEFEIHVTDGQMNGLSRVQVGEADRLFEALYVWRHFWTVEVQLGLIWLSTLLGLLSLTVGVVLRRERVFVWFGLTAILNAIASLNGVVVHPRIDIDVYNWLVFSMRLVSSVLHYLTVLALFGRDSRRLTQLLLSYAVLSAVLVALSGNDRHWVSALYLPLSLAGLVLIGYGVRWCLRPGRNLMQVVSIGLMVLVYASAMLDWQRLGGSSSFEGVYLISYTYSGMLVAMGLLLASRLASALVQSKKMGALLEQQMAQRIAYEVTENIAVGTFTLVEEPGQAARRLNFSFISRRFADITGLPADTTLLSLKSLLRKLEPEYRSLFLRLYRQALHGNPLFSVRLRLLRAQQVRWIHTEAAPRTRTDGSTVWEGVLFDETQQVLAHEAAERDRQALQAHLLEQSRL